jgi:hypothetical protein
MEYAALALVVLGIAITLGWNITVAITLTLIDKINSFLRQILQRDHHVT